MTIELDYSDAADKSCARNAAYVRDVLGLRLNTTLEASRS